MNEPIRPRQALTDERIAELKLALRAMRAASSDFYVAAVMTHVHPFIEFCGLMNEYIALCGDALEQGYDFAMINVHADLPHGLKVPGYRMQYLGEKFGCIFEPYLKVDRKNGKELLDAAGLTP